MRAAHKLWLTDRLFETVFQLPHFRMLKNVGEPLVR